MRHQLTKKDVQKIQDELDRKNLERDFSTSVKHPIHNTSCHTRKCDTSKVMNSATVTLLALENIAPILNGWANAISSHQISPILLSV